MATIPRNALQHAGSVNGAYFLVGPTAVGKTAVAHILARDLSACILSADSMLVYRGMDVGTAKPSSDERAGIEYGGLDLVDPNEPFSVGNYLDHIGKTLSDWRDAKQPVLVVGGTGLYVKCLCEGLDNLPSRNPDLREDAANVLQQDGLEALRQQLRRMDPLRYEKLRDKNNPRRLIRAIELAHAGTHLNGGWTGASAVPLVGLRMSVSALQDRIEQRVQNMFRAGLLAEARSLRSRFNPLSHTAQQAIGYREAFAVLDGRMAEAEAMDQIVIRTRRLAKRQMTWFRNQANVAWIDIDDEMDIAEIASRVKAAWLEYGPTPTKT